MENLDELNAQLLDAKVELKACQAEAHICYEALKEHLTKALESTISPSMAKVSVRESGAQVIVNNREIDLYFYKPSWYHGEEGKGRNLKINFGCFGSFSKDDVDEVKYCEVLGHLAGNMEELDRCLFKTDIAKSLWDAYDTASRAASDVAYKVRSIEGAINSLEAEQRREKIESALHVGCMIMVQKANDWWPAKFKTIEHITGKNIIFKEDYGKRTKKEDLIANLLCNRWEVA